MEQGCNGFSVCAAEHAWRLHLPPGPLPLPMGERQGEYGVAGAKTRWQSEFDPVLSKRRGNVEWMERKHVGNPSRNGCTGPVRAQ